MRCWTLFCNKIVFSSGTPQKSFSGQYCPKRAGVAIRISESVASGLHCFSFLAVDLHPLDMQQLHGAMNRKNSQFFKFELQIHVVSPHGSTHFVDSTLSAL